MSNSVPKYHIRRDHSLDTSAAVRPNKKTRMMFRKKSDASCYFPQIASKTKTDTEPEYELAPDRWSPSGWKYKPKKTRNFPQIIRTQEDYFARDVNQQQSSFKTRNYNWVLPI
eukprot:TRINITY_DN10696_c0_g4_i1.p2 TRINITY_DN10696_c0_g4~~TRINITY_DN10696_c0_g4_i1.p2  ORF type:complete len:113 (+),score=6.27 TRINITY_DN10696_c0_g4_i1:89-427(+)